MAKTLLQLQEQISKEVPYIDIKPYSHNIIGLVLAQIEKSFGKKQAIKVMKKHRLDTKGWTIPKES